MYFDRRLWELTAGLRGRIGLAIGLGLLAAGFGIARFALLGALLFSMLVAPVLSTLLFRKGVRELHNPAMAFLTDRYRKAVRFAIDRRMLTVGSGVAGLGLAVYLAYGGVIGSEFLPRLGEGAL